MGQEGGGPEQEDQDKPRSSACASRAKVSITGTKEGVKWEGREAGRGGRRGGGGGGEELEPRQRICLYSLSTWWHRGREGKGLAQGHTAGI